MFPAACERNSAAIVAVLLNHGVAVNTRCIQGWTALQETVVRSNLEICDMLLKAGAKLNLRNMYGITPLFTAAQNGQMAALHFLIKHGTGSDSGSNMYGRMLADIISYSSGSGLRSSQK